MGSDKKGNKELIARINSLETEQDMLNSVLRGLAGDNGTRTTGIVILRMFFALFCTWDNSTDHKIVNCSGILWMLGIN